MVGGTIAESRFTVRVSELRFSTTLRSKAVKKHCTGVLCLDNAFALIERHPRLRQIQLGVVHGWYTPAMLFRQERNHACATRLTKNCLKWDFITSISMS